MVRLVYSFDLVKDGFSSHCARGSDPNGPKVSKKSEMVIYYSNIYFLHTSRLFKLHRPPENIKKGCNCFLGKIKNHDSKI
jgi:hypothetical protein